MKNIRICKVNLKMMFFSTKMASIPEEKDKKNGLNCTGFIKIVLLL